MRWFSRLLLVFGALAGALDKRCEVIDLDLYFHRSVHRHFLFAALPEPVARAANAEIASCALTVLASRTRISSCDMRGPARSSATISSLVAASVPARAATIGAIAAELAW